MITAPGIYDIPIDQYHNDPNLCDGPSISSSGLKAIAECPAKYWAFSPYNPNRFPPRESRALDVGRAAHALVLGEPEFNRHFVISPYDDFRTAAAKAWRDEQTRTVLKAADYEMTQAMAAAQRATPAVAGAFRNGMPEKSLVIKDKETGIWLRARPDWLPDDVGTDFVIEYKTAVTIEPRKLSADVYRYGYHIQAAVMMDVIAAVTGVSPLGIAHVVQEKEPPYLADLRMFSAEQIEHGRMIYRTALQMFASFLKSGDWPGYTTTPQYFGTPAWVAKQQMEDGIYDD